MYRVVIVEDDPMVSLLNRTFVERDARFQVVQSFQDGRAALAWLEQNPADLAVLDVYMPLFTGLELLHALRGQGVGIDAIMVTAANDAPTVDTLLKLGVVDYLVKPFSFQELEARIKALLRRTGAESAVPLLSCGDLTLDPSSHRAIRGKVVIDLTVKEYRLLEYLIRNQGTAQSRLTLLKNVWDKQFDTNTNVVDVYVNYLRSKIDKDFDHKLIRTVVGGGYMMEA